MTDPTTSISFLADLSQSPTLAKTIRACISLLSPPAKSGPVSLPLFQGRCKEESWT